MDTKFTATSGFNAQDVYTDVQSLQALKIDKNKDASLKKVAQQFESMFTGMMLKSMRQANAVFEEDSMMTSGETKFYRDMYDQQLSLHLSKNKGMGIGDVLYRQFSRQYGPTKPSDDTTAKKSASELGDIKPHQFKDLPARQNFLTPLPGAKVPPEVANHPNAALAALDTMIRQAQSAEFVDPYGINETPHAPVAKTIARAPSPAEYTGPATLESTIRLNMDSPGEFVAQLLPYAKTAAAQLGVNPLMLIAQAALETGWGQRMVKDHLGNVSNNFFNIKSSGGWKGGQVEVSTLEFRNGIARQEQAKFRQYSSVAESFQDYVDFLKNNPRYQQALDTAVDAKQFIKALHGAGYATDPAYSQKVISVFDSLADRLKAN